MQPISSEDLAGLRSKYEAMKELREVHEKAKNDPSFIEPDPKAKLAALAEKFPGALREIDELPFATITSRIEEITGAERDPTTISEWMIVQVTFHRLARGALAVKRWLGKDKSPTREAFERALDAGELTHVKEARLWIDALDQIARPEDGRVMRVVWRRVIADLELTQSLEEARARAFGVAID